MSRKEGKKKLCVICVREQEEMRVLRGVVYMTKSMDRALGTPQEDVYKEDRSVSHLTRKQRDNRYEGRAMDTKPG